MWKMGWFGAVKGHSRSLKMAPVEIYWKNSKIAFCATFGDLGAMYTVHLWLVGKRVVDFLLALIELFSLALTVKAL